MKNTLAEQIHALLDLKKHPKKNAHLPSGATFLDTNVVLMENDHDGDARHPYAEDGLTLWAYSSGNISVQESTFNFFLDSTYGREPYIAFFLGYQKGEEYLPLSITGVGRTYDEGDVSRYLIYTPEAAFFVPLLILTSICSSLYMPRTKRKKRRTSIFLPTSARYFVIGISKDLKIVGTRALKPLLTVIVSMSPSIVAALNVSNTTYL